MAIAVTVSVTGIAINIATDLKTSLLAWIAVVVATVAGGSGAAWTAQLATSGRRVSQVTVGTTVTCSVLAIALEVVAVASVSEGGTAGEPNAGDSTQSTVPRPVQNVASYELISSSDFCPTSDKVDLDTAQSGHGGQTQLGDYLEECRVEGGLAELILEQDEVHSPDNTPLFSLPKPDNAVSHDECRATATNVERLRSRLSLDKLRNGVAFCVRTDHDSVARVSVLDISTSSETHLTIAFTTWR